MADFSSSLGAVFVGLIFSIFLFGIMCAQAFIYFSRYPADRLVYKLLVVSVLVLESLHSVFNCHFFYVYAISNWGDSSINLEPPIWSILAQFPVGVLVANIIRGTYATQVWGFSGHNYWLTGTILGGSVTQVGCAIWATVLLFQVKSFAEVDSIRPAASVVFGVSAFTDILTTVSICWFQIILKKSHKQPRSLVNRLIIYTINTGVLTSAISLSSLIVYEAIPSSLIYLGIYFVQSKMYANSFLAALNTRRIRTERGRNDDKEPVLTPSGTRTFGHSAQISTNSQFDEHYNRDNTVQLRLLDPLHTGPEARTLQLHDGERRYGLAV